jgi:hypothetical protein
MASELRDVLDWWGPHDGFGPLRDDLIDSGEYLEMLEMFRGRYPHVVCRMELTDQLRGF